MCVTQLRYLPIYCTSCVSFWTWEFNQGIPFCAFGNCEASPTIVKCMGIMLIIAFSEAAWSVSNSQTWSPSKIQRRKGKEIPTWVLFLDTSVQVKSRGSFDFSCPRGARGFPPVPAGARGSGQWHVQVPGLNGAVQWVNAEIESWIKALGLLMSLRPIWRTHAKCLHNYSTRQNCLDTVPRLESSFLFLYWVCLQSLHNLVWFPLE